MSKLACHLYGIPPAAQGHVHSHAHILLPLAGELEVTMDGHSYVIPEQHLCFVPPERYHCCLSEKNIIMINIPESMLRSSDVDILSSCVCLPITGEVQLLAQLIKMEVTRNPNCDSVRYLYYYLYEKLLEQGSFKSLQYIRENFGEDISIVTLAKLENYNLTYYSDWFKRQTGVTPTQYIRQVRVEKAKELLSDSDYRLTDIAAQVGYSSGAALTRAFHEVAGISPSEYRSQFRTRLVKKTS